MRKNVTSKRKGFSLAVLFLLTANAGMAQNYFAGTNAGAGNTGTSVTGVGAQALSSSNSGISNAGFGTSALRFNTTGSYNAACGSSSLTNNKTGGANAAFGYTSLLSNVSGSFNCAFGSQSLSSNVSGYQNVAIGRIAMYNNITGYYNVAVGNSALESNDSANCNTAAGYRALRTKVIGDSNVAIGVYAAQLRAAYYRCTFVGAAAEATASGFRNAIAIGYGASVNASNKAVIGNTAVTSIGGWANWTNFSDRCLKKNISKSKLGLDFIMLLNPVTYNYTVEGQKDILQTGLIAQEVDEAAKKAGVDFSGVDKNGEYWGIRYATLTVPLIKAIQEMEEKHAAEKEALNSRIEKLEAAVANMQYIQKGNVIPQEKSFLFQNQPNPFNQSTVIRYSLKLGDEKAILVIRDLNGRSLKQINLASTKGSTTLNAGELPAGTYTYSLLINGECADTKLMIVVK